MANCIAAKTAYSVSLLASIKVWIVPSDSMPFACSASIALL
ncbi:Uncharacterised protein [Vibrio cholerae]|nr:Uncharacterised protein [Vibrio cholerae]